MAPRARIPAEQPPERRPHREDAAIGRHQAVHEGRHLARGPAVRGVAAQDAEQGVERARMPRVLGALALVTPHDEHAVAATEVEVAVLLVGLTIERPQDEARADAVAIAPAVDRRQPPDPVAFLPQPAIAKDDWPR